MIFHPKGCPCLVCAAKGRSAPPAKHEEAKQQGKQVPAKHAVTAALKSPLSWGRWGRRGGQARAARLTPARRREIAQRAAHARWSNHARP